MLDKTILIIEDNEDIRETIKSVLINEGYIVYTASDGQKGLDLLRDEKTRPSLILLDLIMPNLDGWDFLELKDEDVELENISVVIVSGAKDKVASLGRDYIQKPINLISLLDTVDKYCGKPNNTGLLA